MGDRTHTLTAQRIGEQDTMQVTVPADVQREEGIAIDDEVEVAINGVSSLIDRASFETTRSAGDRATIPAQVARQLSLVAGEEYEFEFEKLEDADYAIPDEEVASDEDVEEAIEEAEEELEDEESDGLGDLFEFDDDDISETDPDDHKAEAPTEDEEDEEESDGLRDLFE